jgi:hypothetical protein
MERPKANANVNSDLLGFLARRSVKEHLPLIPAWARYTPRQSAGKNDPE